MREPGYFGAALLIYALCGSALLAAGGDRLALLAAVVAVGCASLPDLDEYVLGLAQPSPTHTLWFAAAGRKPNTG